MNSDDWLTGVVGVAGIVLIALVTVVLRAVMSSRPRPADAGGQRDSPLPGTVAFTARGLGHLFGKLNSPPRSPSVEKNVRRALDRIDTVDPYEGQRRVGMALADVGMVGDPAPAESEPTGNTEPTGHTWPLDDRWHDKRREDQE